MKKGKRATKKKEKRKGVTRSKFQKSKTICLVMENDLFEFIEKQAMQRSLTEKCYIEPNELIREALKKAFPTPKQYDMFGKSK